MTADGVASLAETVVALLEENERLELELRGLRNPVAVSPLVVLGRLELALEEVYPGDQSVEAAALLDQLGSFGLAVGLAR
jgi:hypothetical protein